LLFPALQVILGFYAENESKVELGKRLLHGLVVEKHAFGILSALQLFVAVGGCSLVLLELQDVSNRALHGFRVPLGVFGRGQRLVSLLRAALELRVLGFEPCQLGFKSKYLRVVQL